MVDTIAIIGAGFSGTVTAVNLLRSAPGRPLRIVLINRGAMARGLAYGTASPLHVLNVPAGNMSALADDADDFLHYCRWADPATTPGSFVSRRLYGCYLEALLTAAANTAPEGTVLEQWMGEVARIHVASDGRSAWVALDDGRQLQVQRAVLAFGHLPPRQPSSRRPDLFADARYVPDPWLPGVLERVSPAEPVLLIGSGLTAIDVALSLQQRGRTAPIWMLSRRGLLSASHREQRPPLAPGVAAPLIDALPASARGLLRELRRAAADSAAAGQDWRDLLAALRPHVPALWQRMTDTERRRFLRHLQPYWDVTRHRCAPQPSAVFRRLLEQGELRLLAGRLQDFELEPGGVRARWTPRGGTTERELVVGAVVNCTGPDTDLARAESPLLRQLIASGLLLPDALKLGLSVDARGALLGRDGRPSAVLSYVGPWLRARDWEATAVPELRIHAQRMAARLLQELTAQAASGCVESKPVLLSNALAG